MERRELLKPVAAGGVSAALRIGTSTLRGAIASETGRSCVSLSMQRDIMVARR